MKRLFYRKHLQRIACTALSLCMVASSVPMTGFAASSKEIWPGYPGTDSLPVVNTIDNPFKFFNAANDPNGDGYVSNTGEWTARRDEIKDLVQHYWLGYRWPTKAQDTQGSTKTYDVENSITVGSFMGMGGTKINLKDEYDKLVETVKTQKVEVHEIIPGASIFAPATLGEVVKTVGPCADPTNVDEAKSLAKEAWNAGYYVPYTQWGSQAYAVLKNYTGDITEDVPATRPQTDITVTVTNPDRKDKDGNAVKASFNINVQAPTKEQVKAAWGSEDAKVPFVVDIGGTSAMSAANLNPQGYALVTFTATDIYPDSSASETDPTVDRDGVYTKLYPYDKDTYEYASGALMGWGWGVSQIISSMGQPMEGSTETFGDYLGLDPTKTVVTGHSRYGKAAMFAAAFDDRISICVPSESGGSGIQSYRYKVAGKIFGFNTSDYEKADRVYGVTEVPTISYGFGSSWFPENAAEFLNKDRQLPFDPDDIISLVAPRPFYTVSGIDTHWLGNEGGVASVKAASEVYDYIGTNDIEKNNIAIQARKSDHVFYPRDFCYALSIMDRNFKQGTDDTTLHVQDLFPNGTGTNGMSYPAADYKNVSEFNSYPFDINSSYMPWSSANKYVLWTNQENFLTGHDVTIEAHSDANDVDLYMPDGKTKIDAASHNGDVFTFKLSAAQSVYGRYELRTNGTDKNNRSVYFSAISLSDALRHGTTKGDEGEENRVLGFASRLANTKTDAPVVYVGGSTTPATMSFTDQRVVPEDTTLEEYGIQFHDHLFADIANAGWDDDKTFDVQNLKFTTIPNFTFELSFNKIYASAENNGKDGAAKFTSPISWNVQQYNNGEAGIWPAIPDTLAERDELTKTGTVTRAEAKPTETNFDTKITSLKAVANGADKTDIVIDFNEPLNKGQFGFGLDVADKWDTTWNDAGTEVTLTFANNDKSKATATGNLIIFRLMDTDGNLIGGPIEKSFTVPSDPTTLTNEVANLGTVDEALYTPASYAAYTSALNNAKAVLAKASSQNDIDNALNALRVAKNELKAKADKKALNEAITKAQAVDTAKYDAASADAFTKALAAAKSAAADENISQADTDASLKALNDAMAGLKEKTVSNPKTSSEEFPAGIALLGLSALAVIVTRKKKF